MLFCQSLTESFSDSVQMSIVNSMIAMRVCCKGAPASDRMDMHMRELGLEHCASQAGVRQAYKLGAARWHPDKWMQASEAEQALAKQRFLLVTQAYEALMELQSQ